MSLGDVVNQLLNEDSLSDTSTTEQTNLSTTSVGSEQIDDLDTSNENLSSGRLVYELRRIGVNGQTMLGFDGSTLVDRVTSDVNDTTKCGRADRNCDGSAGISSLGASDETLGTYEKMSFLIIDVDLSKFLPSMAMQRTTFSPKCCFNPVSNRQASLT